MALRGSFLGMRGLKCYFKCQSQFTWMPMPNKSTNLHVNLTLLQHEDFPLQATKVVTSELLYT